MRIAAGLLCVAAMAWGQTSALRPLHVSPTGVIVDDSGKPALLRGLNRSLTGSGNADAAAPEQEYAAQSQLLSMNLVRIFVNAAWWTNNVQVPIVNLKYQDFIDLLIQRSRKYGNYALIVKAGQFPDAPCGEDGRSCPASNQGDLNCQANAAVCAAQDTTGNNIDTAFAFWATFSKKYAGDPAVLYDTWEDMHGVGASTWSDDQNQLIAAIRTYAPQSLIFVEDTAAAFEAIAAGTIPDFAWSNIVWNFHLYNAPAGSCTQPVSPRYTNWPHDLEPLVSYAQQRGHALAFTEWGGCNDSEPYHTNIVSYARLHSIALSYFDSGNLLSLSGGNYRLTAFGAKVAQAYTAIAGGASAPAPVITLVANAAGEAPLIAPNTWVEIKGTNLAPAGDSRVWQGADFAGGKLPTQLDGVSVTVNGKNAFVYYVSPTQVNILTPPDPIQGVVLVQLGNGGPASAPASAQSQAVSPSFFVFGGGPHVAAVHANGNLLGPANLYPGASTPARPGETVLIFANGFGAVSTPVVSGSATQLGSLPSPPVIRIGGVAATVSFAGLVAPGEFQFNVVVPASVGTGDQPISASYNGANTQAGTVIAVQIAP